jgi:phosphatidylethanolamine/phosphatidyl-N-methylethanolamine N-methyltransferase
MSLNEFDLGKWYENDYATVNASANPNSFAFKYMHKSLEQGFQSNSGLSILEIGANIGEHINFVAKDFDSYIFTDIREPKITDMKNSKIKFQIADVQNLPFEDSTFDRVISTCVFHHLNDPVKGLQELRRVVRVGGHISILLPNDPGIMYRVLRSLTTLRTAKRLRVLPETQLVHALEHKNHYLAIKTLIAWIFGNDQVKTKFKPFVFPGYNINAMTVINIKRLK